VSGQAAIDGHRRADLVRARWFARDSSAWTVGYLRRVAVADGACALAAGLLAFEIRFDVHGHTPPLYLAFTGALPILWCLAVALAGGYDARFIGVGSDEFRRVLNAGVALVAGIALISYATKSDIARGYVVVALPCVVLFNLVARQCLRKRLHRLRAHGACMRRVVAVGHARAVADLIVELRRETYHGLSVVAACLAGNSVLSEIAGVPVAGGLGGIGPAVRHFDADTVAVLACPEMNGMRLRELAWELEKTDTHMWVAPVLLDVAGPRTTIRPVAGLPLLHVDHPELAGSRRMLKAVFDWITALSVLVLLAPFLLAVTVAIRIIDGGPVLFRQVRVGKHGRPFKVYKFRTMAADAEVQQAALAERNQASGVLFKIRDDPRITRTGGRLRRYSIDELPQLVNVLKGEMSLVGPRPALPAEAARYGYYVKRRLVVKPGMTGLWQVKGRSDLSWEESVRLDIRYVESWSFMLDLQILWKTWSAVFRGSGAY
jgi:exopolysaccharide biosynthesis polyprenyl glycosylphosphotransferase